MSTARSTTPPPDLSPLYLWPLADALETLPTTPAAPGPQARRLAVLVAEALAAGQHRAVLLVLTGWAAVLHRLGPDAAGRSALHHAIDAIEAWAMGSPPSPELRALLEDLAEIEDPYVSPAEQAASELASWALLTLADTPLLTASAAWLAAHELLCLIAAAAGDDDADGAIARCAEIAHHRLFTQETR